MWVALPIQNGADDQHARDPSDVAEDIGQLNVHQVQRLLHMLNMGDTPLKQILTMTHQGAHSPNLFTGLKGTAQEAIAVQLLNALAIHHIAFGTPCLVHMMRIDQMDSKAFAFQNLKDGNPVDAGRFHCYACHATIPQPRCQCMQINREGREEAHTFLAATGRDGCIYLAGADIQPGRMQIDRLQCLHLLCLHHLSLSLLLVHKSSPCYTCTLQGADSMTIHLFSLPNGVLCGHQFLKPPSSKPHFVTGAMSPIN